MSTGTILATVVAVIVVVAVVVAGIMQDMRRRRLRQRFGSEYDRLVNERDSRRQAEAELAKRERRFKTLGIRSIDPERNARFSGEWTAIQERFIDAPAEAVRQALRLVTKVMNERGYPTEDHRQVLADLSVQHAKTLDHYRTAHAISGSVTTRAASTEDMRQAMLHYRVFFWELLGHPRGAVPRAATAEQAGTGIHPVSVPQPPALRTSAEKTPVRVPQPPALTTSAEKTPADESPADEAEQEIPATTVEREPAADKEKATAAAVAPAPAPDKLVYRDSGGRRH